MAETQIIPGVQVQVIKEVVAPQLAPSGVLGIVGLTADPPTGRWAPGTVVRVSNWARFRELFGAATAASMPEVKQAFENGVFEVVVAPVQSDVAKTPSVRLDSLASTKPCLIELAARVSGTWCNGLEVEVELRGPDAFDLTVRRGRDVVELHRNVSASPMAERYLGRVLDGSGSLLRTVVPEVAVVSTTSDGSRWKDVPQAEDNVHWEALFRVAGEDTLAVETAPSSPRLTLLLEEEGEAVVAGLIAKSGGVEVDVLEEQRFENAAAFVERLRGALREHSADLPGVRLAHPARPDAAVYRLAGGIDAPARDYEDAIDLLAEVPDVDLVIAAVQDFGVDALDSVADIYGKVVSHCREMSGESKGRIGFGQVPVAQVPDVEADAEWAAGLVSDRFVLVAPHGLLGAVAGLVGGLPYHHSPTFKALSGVARVEPALRIGDQRAYLTRKIVPIAQVKGRGIVVLQGLTTDGDQISVRRVADRAVRGVKMIGELFIGKLNNENGRNALKQKLTEFLIQMEKDGAIVPSTDGADPAFKLDVYSSQADFAKGIVRVDLALRPVRAIDFIYATVLVQV